MKKTLVIIQVIIATVLFSLHHTVSLLQLGREYTPFSVGKNVSSLVFDEANFYLPSARRLMRGGELTSEMDIYEYKSRRNGHAFLHAIILGTAGRVIGNMELVWMFSHAMFPALVWLLTYKLSKWFTVNTSLRFLIAWTFVLVPFGPRNILLLGEWALVQPLELTRMPQPSLSLTVLLSAIYATCIAIKSGAWKHVILAGFLSGLVFYAYYFYWVAMFLALGILFAAFLVMKMTAQARTVFRIACAAVVVGLPYILLVLAGMADGGHKDMMLRQGTFTRGNLSTLGIFIFISVLIYLYLLLKKQTSSANNLEIKDTAKIVLLAFVGAGAFGLNFHLVTGFDAEHAHFYNRLIQPMLFIYFCALAVELLQKFEIKPRIIAFAGCFLIPCFLLLAAYRQIQAGSRTLACHDNSSNSNNVLVWVRENVPVQAVVGATDNEMISLIPGIAGNWSFVPLGLRTMAPDLEIIKRFLIVSYLEGKNFAEIENVMRGEFQESCRANLAYTLITRKNFSDDIIQESRGLWDGINIQEDLLSRKLDYIITKSKLEDIRVMEIFPNSTIVFSSGAWSLIQLVKY